MTINRSTGNFILLSILAAFIVALWGPLSDLIDYLNLHPNLLRGAGWLAVVVCAVVRSGSGCWPRCP